MGYQIRFESVKTRDCGAINYCTTGIVFQKLRADPNLSSVSHIILDEVHERDLHTDVLLGVVKSLVSRTANLKLIVMSASLDIQMFSRYLNCPVVETSGKLSF